MMQYLVRRFPDAELGDLARRASRPLGKAAVDETLFPPAFYRLIRPDHVASPAEIEANPDPVGRATARALHCDHLGLPDNFIATLETLARYDRYALTHAFLAARWAVENRCLTEESVARFQSSAVERVDAMLERIDLTSDLGVEAVAMLYYGGASRYVRPKWTAAIAGAQRDDGGWAASPDVAISNPHTTYLALWVLLEDAFPHAADVPMIDR